MIYLGTNKVTRMNIGSLEEPMVFLYDKQVYPDGNYTYELVDVQLKYSRNTTSLKPDQSNYAYLSGTYKVYKDGTLESSTTVTLTPSFSSDLIVSTGDYIYWNKEKYGKSTRFTSSVSISGSYAGITAGTFTVKLDANSSSYSSTDITEFTIGGYSSPHTFPSASNKYIMSVKGNRQYRWSSGILDRETPVEAYNTSINIDAKITARGITQGIRSIYEFTNNSDAPVTITAYVESTYEWFDTEHMMPDYYTVQDYETFTLEPHSSYTTRNLAADAGEYIQYQGSYSYQNFFEVNYKPFYLYDVGKTYSYELDVPYNPYFTFASNASWLTISDLTVNMNQNSGSARSAVITLTDKVYPSSTTTYNITQS